MGEDAQSNTYILGTEERRRLELLQDCLDPITTRSLDAIGVEPGWRCLELGAGGGSVTQMLCRRVGPAGRVAAVDLDTRFVEELRDENLDVHRSDILADGFPGDAYDLVHTRALLMHLPTREKLVGEMAAAVRPGGWLLVEDLDTFPLQHLAEGVFAEVFDKALAAFDATDTAATFGRQLPALFDAAGLEDVEVVCEVMTYRGGSTPSEMFMASFSQALPLLLKFGLTEDRIDDLRDVLNDPTRWFSGFAVYSVRGRVPEA